MTSTYVAWNGQPYRWPPPEGWYLASDGQWWAPGTGPNPPSRVAPTKQAAQRPAEAARPAIATRRPEAERSVKEQQQTRAVAPSDDQHITTPQRQPTPKPLTKPVQQLANPSPEPTPKPLAKPAQQLANSQQQAVPEQLAVPRRLTKSQPLDASFASAPVSPLPGIQAAPPNTAHTAPSGGAVWQQQSQQHPEPSSGGPPKGLFIGLGAFLGLIALGAITLILTGGDDNSPDPASALEAAEEDIAANTTEPSPSTTTVDQATTSTVTTTTAPPSTTESSATASSTDASATADAPPSTIAEPMAEEATDPAVSEEAQVAAYRARLDEDGLSAEQLSNEDVVEFGTSFCTFASIADDTEAFDSFREPAIAQSDGNLNDDELNFAIDNAIIVFCPEEAERLGIS